jgi:hypothetical protein
VHTHEARFQATLITSVYIKQQSKRAAAAVAREVQKTCENHACTVGGDSPSMRARLYAC